MRILISRMSIVLTAIVTLLFLYTSPAFTYLVTLSWETPTKNADGTPLTDLQGFRVYYGASSHNYSHNIDVGNVTSYTANSLVSGVTYYFAVTAYDSSGNQSNYSNEVSTAQYVLTINKGGIGNGTVTSALGGINCGSGCKESYKNGTVVTLAAAPDTGSLFTGWSGSGCAGNGQCALTLNANTTITANFNATTTVVKLTSPKAGEVIPSGSTYTIRWEASPTATKFDLIYSMNNGAIWKPIANTITGTSYNWSVPTPPNNKTGCLVRITGYDSYGTKTGEDTSDGTFMIEIVRVISPNGGEALKSGNTLTIQWQTNKTIRPVAKTQLKYTCDGGIIWNRIHTLPGNPGSYTWTVPYVSSAQCKVKAVLRDAGGKLVGIDSSDAYFTNQP